MLENTLYPSNLTIRFIDFMGMSAQEGQDTDEYIKGPYGIKLHKIFAGSHSGITYDSDGDPVIRIRHYNSPPGMSGGGGSRKRGEAVNDELPLNLLDKENGEASSGGGEVGFWNALVLAWDLKVIGKDFPDLISFDVTLNSTAVAGASMIYSFNLFTRGQRGINITAIEQNRFGGEIDWGLNLNIGYYKGNPLNITQASLAGPVNSISAGWGYSGQGYFRYDATGKHIWTGFGLGFGLSGGISHGFGRTRIIWP